MDKKAQNITITTIVIIVLALIVLVVLILGFTGGWGNLWSRITGIFGGGANVDSIVQACSVACSTNAEYDYCTRQRTINWEEAGETKEAKATCNQIEEQETIKEGDEEIKLPSTALSCGIDCPSEEAEV